MLKPAQQRALNALLVSPTQKEAAKAAGISEDTIYRYLQMPEFQAEYKRAFTGLVTDATREAQQALHPALKALKDIVEDENETAGNRIAAARSLLEYGLKLTEFNDILKTLEGEFDCILTV